MQWSREEERESEEQRDNEPIAVWPKSLLPSEPVPRIEPQPTSASAHASASVRRVEPTSRLLSVYALHDGFLLAAAGCMTSLLRLGRQSSRFRYGF